MHAPRVVQTLCFGQGSLSAYDEAKNVIKDRIDIVERKKTDLQEFNHRVKGF